MASKPKNKNRKLLQNQKVGKRKKRPFSLSKSTLAPILIFFLGALIFVFILLGLRNLNFFPTNKYIAISISQNISVQNKHLIQDFLGKNPVKSLEELHEVSSRIQRLISAKEINAIALSGNKAHLRIHQHEAESVIVYGTKRLLSKEGKIFGKYREREHSNFPVITGIPIDTRVKFNRDRSVKLSAKNMKRVQDAILLIRDGLRYNITYKAIHYNPDRGFQVLLRDKRIRVEMGRAPFKNRYTKLVKILTNLSKKRVAKARIELDYQGKAFIKEYSL